MADLGAAVRFVRAHATSLESARLLALVGGAPAARETLAVFESSQRDDGGWAPFWNPTASGLDATCFRIAQLDELGVAREDRTVVRALTFLGARQRDDGSWDEAPELAENAPPWTRPGSPAAVLYLTAQCGYWLSVLGTGPAADRAVRAAAFLEGRVGPDGNLPTFGHGQWLSAGLFLRLGRRRSAERVLHPLEDGLATMDPGALAWMVVALSRAAGDAPIPLVVSARARLEALQRGDGGWSSGDGPGFEVEATLQAIRALMSAR